MKKLLVTIFALCLSSGAGAVTMDDVYNIEEKGDVVAAFKAAKVLADKGNAEAQQYLVGLIIEGKHVKLDYPQAIKYAKLCSYNKKAEDEMKGQCLRILSIITVRSKLPSEDESAKLAFKYQWQSARIGNSQAHDELISSLCSRRGETCPEEIEEMLPRCPDGPCARDKEVVENDLNNSWLKAHQGNAKAKAKLTSMICTGTDSSCPQKLAEMVRKCADVKSCAQPLADLTAN